MQGRESRVVRREREKFKQREKRRDGWENESKTVKQGDLCDDQENQSQFFSSPRVCKAKFSTHQKLTKLPLLLTLPFPPPSSPTPPSPPPDCLLSVCTFATQTSPNTLNTITPASTSINNPITLVNLSIALSPLPL